MTMKASIAVGCALALLPAVSLAQAPPAPATPPAQTAPANPDHAGSNCTPTEAVPEEGTVASRGATTGRAGSLGDQLAKSDGVLCPPPGVDPQMYAPTPPGGPMPVIPPPGGPGGDPSVRPK